MKKLSAALCFIHCESFALTCPSGSTLINDGNYFITCGDSCPAGSTKITNDAAIVKFEITACGDAKGTFDATCSP